MYAQGFFVLDQIKTLAPQHPAWQTEQPFASILAGDEAAMKQFSEEDIGKLMAAAHTGMTTTEFDEQALAWAHSAKNPSTGNLSSSRSISRSWSYSTISVATASRPTSSPAVGST